MKKSFLKALTILLSLSILIAVFSGCSSKNTYADRELSLPGDISVKDLKETTLTFLLPGEKKPDARKVLDEIEKRTKDSLNIKLDFQWMDYPALVSQVGIALDTQLPDIDGFFYFSPNALFSYNNYAQKGALKDLTKLLPEYAPKLYSKLSNEEIKYSRVNGKLIAVPRLYPFASYSSAVVREDLRKKYNLPEIKTLDDYELYLKTIKANEKGMSPGSVFADSISVYANMSGYAVLDSQIGLVYKWDDPRMKLSAWEGTPEFKKYIGYMTNWRKNGYLVNTTELDQVDLSLNSDYIYQMLEEKMLSGKMSSTILTSGISEDLNMALKTSSHPGWEFKDYPLYTDGCVQRLSPIEGSIAFNAYSPDVERALMFLEWVESSQENYDLLMYGIEGEDYVKGENKTYSLPSGVTWDQNPYVGWGGHQCFSNIEFHRNSKDYPKEMLNKELDILNNSSKYPPHLGFLPDYSSVDSEVGGRARSYRMELEPGILSGKINSSTLDAAVKEQKDAGIDRIINEVQKQLDKWRTSGK